MKEEHFGRDGIRIHKIDSNEFLKDIQAIDDWKLVGILNISIPLTHSYSNLSSIPMVFGNPKDFYSFACWIFRV